MKCKLSHTGFELGHFSNDKHSVSVSLFNGILAFAGYLMPNPSLYKNSLGIIQPIVGGIRGRIPFYVLPLFWRNSFVFIHDNLFNIKYIKMERFLCPDKLNIIPKTTEVEREY